METLKTSHERKSIGGANLTPGSPSLDASPAPGARRSLGTPTSPYEDLQREKKQFREMTKINQR